MKLIAILIASAAVFLAACTTTKRPAPAPGEPVLVEARGQRPGLGTQKAEQRESWVEKTAFSRAWTTRSGFEGSLYYNDGEGVDAMLDYLSGESKHRTGLYPIGGGLVSVGLRDKDGQWYSGHELKGKRFVVGIIGERYEIVVRNETSRRLEIVLSIDGYDVLDGETASVRKRGYVVEGDETLVVEGYRTSDSTVAAFRFGTVPESYANLKKRGTAHVGIIGVAAFEERTGGSSNGNRDAWRKVTAPPAPPQPPPQA